MFSPFKTAERSNMSKGMTKQTNKHQQREEV